MFAALLVEQGAEELRIAAYSCSAYSTEGRNVAHLNGSLMRMNACWGTLFVALWEFAATVVRANVNVRTCSLGCRFSSRACSIHFGILSVQLLDKAVRLEHTRKPCCLTMDRTQVTEAGHCCCCSARPAVYTMLRLYSEGDKKQQLSCVVVPTGRMLLIHLELHLEQPIE